VLLGCTIRLLCPVFRCARRAGPGRRVM